MNRAFGRTLHECRRPSDLHEQSGIPLLRSPQALPRQVLFTTPEQRWSSLCTDSYRRGQWRMQGREVEFLRRKLFASWFAPRPGGAARLK